MLNLKRFTKSFSPEFLENFQANLTRFDESFRLLHQHHVLGFPSDSLHIVKSQADDQVENYESDQDENEEKSDFKDCQLEWLN